MVSEFFNTLYEKGDVKHVLVIAKGINFIDLAGATWLTYEAKKWQKRGGGIYFSGLKIVSQKILTKGGFRKQIGEENFYTDKPMPLALYIKSLTRTFVPTVKFVSLMSVISLKKINYFKI